MTTNEKINDFTDFLEDHTDPIGEQQKKINEIIITIDDDIIYTDNKEEESFQKLAKFLGEQQKKLIDLIDIDYEYVTDIEFDGIDHSDAPGYCDAYISSACYHDIEMCDELLDKLNEDRDFVYDKLINYLY